MSRVTATKPSHNNAIEPSSYEFGPRKPNPRTFRMAKLRSEEDQVELIYPLESLTGGHVVANKRVEDDVPDAPIRV